MDISFLIPTIRPFDSYLNRVVDNINSIPSKYQYEICVFSKEESKGKNVRWFPEPERKGPLYGFNHMARESDGEFKIILSDDMVFINSFDLVIDFLKSDFFKDRKYKITSLNCGDRVCNPLRGQILGDVPIDFDVKQFSLIRFPVFDKKTLRLLDNHIFIKEVFYHAGDIAVSQFVGVKGEPPVDGPTHIRAHSHSKDSSWEVTDCNVVRLFMKDLYQRPDRKYIE